MIKVIISKKSEDEKEELGKLIVTEARKSKEYMEYSCLKFSFSKQ